MILFPFVILFFSLIITTFNSGFFSFAAFAVLLNIFILLLLIFFRGGQLRSDILSSSNQQTIRIILSLIFVFTYTTFLFFAGGIYQTELHPTIFMVFIPLLLLPLILTYLDCKNIWPLKTKKLRFAFIIISALVLRILMVKASPDPVMDVYTILKEAPIMVLQGRNPYVEQFSQVYSGTTPDYFTYWPVAFLTQIPFVTVFNDPRVLMILAEVGSALLIFLLGNKTDIAELLSLIYLFRPNSNFIIEQSFLVPLESFLFILSVYLLYQKNRKHTAQRVLFSGALLGLLTGVKLHQVFLLPFFLLFTKERKKYITGFLSAIFVTVLPFVLWNPKAFKSDTLDWLVKPVGQIASIPVYNSLNVNSFLFALTRQTLPMYASFLIPLAVLLLILYKLKNYSKNNTKKSFLIPHVILGIAVFYVTLYLFQRFAFINYYYFVTNIIILWLLFLLRF